MGSSEKQAAKKLYERPVLTVYGTVHELTQKVGPRGHGDGGKIPPRIATSLH